MDSTDILILIGGAVVIWKYAKEDITGLLATLGIGAGAGYYIGKKGLKATAKDARKIFGLI